MVDFGIGGVWEIIIRSVELFLAVGLLVIPMTIFVEALFVGSLKTKLENNTSVKAASESVRKLQPDENKYVIRPEMKPHFHGSKKIGYVEEGQYGTHIFNHKGQIKGIVGSAQNGREYLRGVHKVSIGAQTGTSAHSDYFHSYHPGYRNHRGTRYSD